MVPVTADFIVRWTARAFVACYVVRLGLDAAGRCDSGSQRAARWIWTTGCAICWIHFAAAFQLVHHGSFREAYQHVLNVTVQSTGLETGIGLSINLAFGVLWLVDAGLWWRDIGWSERRIQYWFVQGIFAFLIFQATVVFGPRFWVAIAPTVALLLVGLRLAAAARARNP